MPKESSHLDTLLAATWDRELELCRKDVSHFAFNHVMTKDEHDRVNAVKALPDKEYLRILFNTWDKGELIQFVAKSRQLMVSWALCVYTVWTARFHPHQLCLFQSKKLEDAQKMVFLKWPDQARCSFIENNLPAFIKVCWDGKKWLPIDLSTACNEGTIVYPNGSRVEAIPQGPTHIESRVPSLYVNDEATLQEEWRAGYAASLPCLTGPTVAESGRAIHVATMRLPSAYGEEIKNAGDVDPDLLLKGVSEFRSAVSNIYTMRIHYSADPAKDPERDGAEWFHLASSRFPGGVGGIEWQQHMEINPVVRSGDRVLPMWPDIADRVIEDPIPFEAQHGWTYRAGLDYGARNNTVWLVIGTDMDGVDHICHEESVPGNQTGGIPGFCGRMKATTYLTRVNYRIQSDPSIWNKDQNTGGGLKSKAQIFAENGVHLTPAQSKGQVADELTVERISGHYWSDWDSEDFQPKLKIFNTCKNLIKWWPTLRYEDWQERLRDDRALKEKMHDLHMDEWDAFKYAEVSRQNPTSQKPVARFGSVNHLKSLIVKKNTNLSSRYG